MNVKETLTTVFSVTLCWPFWKSSSEPFLLEMLSGSFYESRMFVIFNSGVCVCVCACVCWLQKVQFPAKSHFPKLWQHGLPGGLRPTLWRAVSEDTCWPASVLLFLPAWPGKTRVLKNCDMKLIQLRKFQICKTYASLKIFFIFLIKRLNWFLCQH